MPQAPLRDAFDGVACLVLAAAAGSPHVRSVQRCLSTMDIGHQMGAEGAPHGSVIVADVQDAGRGRSGARWSSATACGVWASVLLRATGESPPGVLSLRVGLTLARELDHCAHTRVRLKWPNDLWLPEGKLAGILTEARWRGDSLEWMVVGVGVNLSGSVAVAEDTKRDYRVAALRDDVTRSQVLVKVVRSVLSAATFTGELQVDELDQYAHRDFASGREISSPVVGTIHGISARGALLVRLATGTVVPVVAGSIVFSSPLEV